MPHHQSVQQVELLAVSAGQVGGKPTAILTIRANPEESFEAINLALSKPQADRLRKELDTLFATSQFLRSEEKR